MAPVVLSETRKGFLAQALGAKKISFFMPLFFFGAHVVDIGIAVELVEALARNLA